MTEEIKDLSNIYEITTLNQIRLSKSIVKAVRSATPQQKEVLFWELLAEAERTKREKALLLKIKEIKETIK